MEERRKEQFEGQYGLAILYTIGYLALMGTLMLHEIPGSNRELLLTLAGIMSAAQLGIIKYYYDGSKGADTAQVANLARSSRTDAVIQEIAKTAPAAVAAAATGAPISPADVPKETTP